MNFGNGWRQKLRHGSASLAITAGVIVAVILLNVLVTALCTQNLWQIDLSPASKYNVYSSNSVKQKDAFMYTLMDETVSYLDHIFQSAAQNAQEGESVEVDIIFCADPDLLMDSDTLRYVYYTALQMQKAFPGAIKVSHRDVWNNPSSVDAYRSTSYSNIYQTNVIVASGSEFRISSVQDFFRYDDTTNEIAAYNGQQELVQQILAVTRADAPICALTVNHGEPFAGLNLAERATWSEYKEFMNVIEGAGYEIRFLDLETEEIPENCRLIITYDPQSDFVSSFESGGLTTSETRKLDRYLDQAYSYMVFVDADTPALPNMEEYLSMWGISFARYSGKDAAGERVSGNYRVSDPANAIDGTGLSFVAQYGKGSLGKSVLTDVSTAAVTPKIIFGNAMPIRYSSSYRTVYTVATEKNEAYSFGNYEGNGWARAIYDIFTAGTTDAMAQAYAVQNGEHLKDAGGYDIVGSDIYKVMTISAETRFEDEGTGQNNTSVNNSTFVCAVGSTDFAKDALLGSKAYGNTDVLLSVLRMIGEEIDAMDLWMIAMYEDAISTDHYLDATTGDIAPSLITATVVLVALPALCALGFGGVILIRRKVRR